MTRAIYLAVLLTILPCNALFANAIEDGLRQKGFHVAVLSMEDRIRLQVNRMEQAIREQWIGDIEQILSVDFQGGGAILSRETAREELASIFSRISEASGVAPQINPETGWKLTSTQDFYLRVLKIDASTEVATVQCEMGFCLAGRHFNGIRDRLTFAWDENMSSLTSSENLFPLLREFSESTTTQMIAVHLSNAVLGRTKDDFTSAGLLIPVTLCNYGKTPVPRFNRSESLHWFENDCMSSPYGIVADIEICEGGPDFNHDYLFVSDLGGDKIVGSDQDDWVGEFGVRGSGHGQFWGPRGICTLEGYYYFVADMFNDRVVAYIYYNELEEPWFYENFDLYADFNRPRDVAAKERRPGDILNRSYIAIADEGNHRIVLFRWVPAFGWERNYGQYGSGQGRFMWPSSVCFGREPDSSWQTNDLFVTDYGNRRLVKLRVGPDLITWAGSYQFPVDAELSSVDVDNNGLVYVVDRHNGKVYKFTPGPASSGPTLLGIWGETGTQDGQLYHPNTIEVAHGRYVPYPNPWVPLTGLGDVFITESWGNETGVRRFVIAADIVNLNAEWVPFNESTGQGNFIWWNYHLTDCATVTEQVLLGAEVCTTYTRGVLNWGSQGGAWPVTGHPHGTYYTVKITANSTYDPTIVLEKTLDVYVDTLSTHNPVITRGIRCHWINEPFATCDGCWQCIKENRGYTIDVQAVHPDGYPLTYEWECGRGYFTLPNKSMCNPCIIDTNTICYMAPEAPGKTDHSYEFIRVTVRDPYEGDAGTDINTDDIFDSEYSCLCGDANCNGIVNLGDAMYIQIYLFGGGDPPPDPIERADANNDHVIDMGDMIHLLNYLFKAGDPPECCWLHE